MWYWWYKWAQGKYSLCFSGAPSIEKGLERETGKNHSSMTIRTLMEEVGIVGKDRWEPDPNTDGQRRFNEKMAAT